ncbi:uncharacterized protein LOC119401837 [Rhipicephalus sanguineus]|uniref:uncharacterized protein LOC119401837 n=1 Tax=Rhipicephalus sanguineus TaxID=34632 RepID=UPI001894B46A|nr:uncharacterized protein LOC119401837 [Rhipicephalus sanguineus]
MAPDIYSHAVFGFSPSLDWSILHFVKPIDDIRVCSACRAVARKTAFLACRHVLCEPCYEHWRSRGSHVCFLDGDLCPENEVHWMEFPAEKMMKSEVSCWNRDNGCEIITEVSSITDHFHLDCEHHTACCPKCSSTVLRKDIIAHLESQCANHALKIKSTTPPSEGVHKEVQGFSEGVRGKEMGFRKASLNDLSLATSLQGMTARDEENVDSLSKMAVELVQMLEVTKQTLSAVKKSSEGHVNEIAYLKTCKENLCAEFDEITKVAGALGPCESADQQEMRESEENAAQSQAMKGEMQSLSSILEDLANKIYATTAVAKSTVADGLSEVLSCNISSTRQAEWLGEEFPLGATARVFENELKVPVKIVWCVYEWAPLRLAITAKDFCVARTSIVADGRYEIRLAILQRSHIPLFSISVFVSEPDGAAVGVLPENVTLFFISRRTCIAENEINLTKLKRGSFLPVHLSVDDLQRRGIIQGDVLNLCFKFSY